MKFLLLGTGNMARFLAGRLAHTPHTCTGVWGRNRAAAAHIAATLNAPVAENISHLPTNTEAVLLAVADGAVAEVAQQLPAHRGTLVHFSGTLPLSALLPHPNQAVCWPVYSIGGEMAGGVTIPFAGEASLPAGEKVLFALTEALGGTLTLMDATQRAQLHLAAVLVNNFVNHLLVLGKEVTAAAQLSFTLLQPIIAQTAARAAGGGQCLVQTGPAVRGDGATEAAHGALLAQHPEWAAVYKALSSSIKAHAKSKA